MQNPTKTMVKLTRCSLVTTCSNLKERSATNQGQSEIFRKHTCIFFFDIIDALSKAIVNHPTILPYIYTHTDKKWVVCIGLWHCFTSITSIYGNIFKYKTIQPVDAPSWSRTRLRSAGTSAVPPDQGFSRDFMEVEPSNIYQTYGNIRQYYIKNDWLMIIRGCIQNIAGYHPWAGKSSYFNHYGWEIPELNEALFMGKSLS